MDTFFEWLGNTRWSVALLESLHVWPLIESTHVLSLGLFAGTVLMNDLRLLGVSFTRIPASEFTSRVLWWTRLGFVIMVITGLLLFYSSPLRYYHNVFFRFKLAVIAIALVNIVLFHSRIHKRVSDWDLDPKPPRAARIAAVVSIVAWASVIIAGRMIAYNWFDCDIQPQPGWVNWLADCNVPAE